ncbi:hypothetical protein [Sphingosinithalassobacter portus]|uniref:hypothetical protein n=1 Tax=Stakelama portus TaxID=2676234 RepID=UPI0011AB4A2F|nr:hypothetical protein [Sphingosinithalassobacter portus]
MRNFSIASAVIAILTTGCSNQPSTTQSNPSSNDIAEQSKATLPHTPTPVQIETACKDAIAKLFGQPVSIMKATDQNGFLRVHYNRPDDGKLWTNDCRVEGDRIIWRGVENGAPGRWRNGPYDETITYQIEGDNVSVEVSY